MTARHYGSWSAGAMLKRALCGLTGHRWHKNAADVPRVAEEYRICARCHAWSYEPKDWKGSGR